MFAVPFPLCQSAKPKRVPVPARMTLDGKHPVSLLGELASKRKWGSPQYDVVHETGPQHQKSFVFKVSFC
jgi:protein SON